MGEKVILESVFSLYELRFVYKWFALCKNCDWQKACAMILFCMLFELLHFRIRKALERTLCALAGITASFHRHWQRRRYFHYRIEGANGRGWGHKNRRKGLCIRPIKNCQRRESKVVIKSIPNCCFFGTVVGKYKPSIRINGAASISKKTLRYESAMLQSKHYNLFKKVRKRGSGEHTTHHQKEGSLTLRNWFSNKSINQSINRSFNELQINS